MGKLLISFQKSLIISKLIADLVRTIYCCHFSDLLWLFILKIPSDPHPIHRPVCAWTQTSRLPVFRTEAALHRLWDPVGLRVCICTMLRKGRIRQLWPLGFGCSPHEQLAEWARWGGAGSWSPACTMGKQPCLGVSKTWGAPLSWVRPPFGARGFIQELYAFQSTSTYTPCHRLGSSRPPPTGSAPGWHLWSWCSQKSVSGQQGPGR